MAIPPARLTLSSPGLARPGQLKPWPGLASSNIAALAARVLTAWGALPASLGQMWWGGLSMRNEAAAVGSLELVKCIFLWGRELCTNWLSNILDTKTHDSLSFRAPFAGLLHLESGRV